MSRMCSGTPSPAGHRGGTSPTLAIPYLLGAFLFPIMGYMIATLSDQPELRPAIKYFANFTLFGAAAVLMIVLLVNQWAVRTATCTSPSTAPRTCSRGSRGGAASTP